MLTTHQLFGLWIRITIKTQRKVFVLPRAFLDALIMRRKFFRRTFGTERVDCGKTMTILSRFHLDTAIEYYLGCSLFRNLQAVN